MKKIDIIPWNDNFCTGINQIDEEHKKLVEIINVLATKFAYNSHNLNINIIFDELLNYTKYHFSSEELIWGKYLKDDKSNEHHEKNHEKFIEQLKDLINQQKNKPIEELAEKTLSFLVKWLVSHILEADRFLAYKALSIKDGHSIEKSTKIAEEKMSGQTKKLTDLVISMYKVLSNNTVRLMKETAKQEQIQKKLQDEKTKYKKLMTLGSDMVYILDFSGNILEYSEQVIKNLGYDKEEMKEIKLYNIDKSLTPKKNKEYLSQLSTTPIQFTSIHTKKDGKEFDVEITAVKMKINGKNYVYASARDVSERIKNENTIKTKKDEFEAIFKSSKDGIAIIDLESNFLDFNDAYLEMTGFSRKELLTKSCIGLTVPKDVERSIAVMEEVKEKGFVANYEKQCYVKDNAIIHVNMTGSLLPDKKRILLIAKDVSSLKLLEEQSKMAAMGEMIGNIAHQWRQPLSVISSAATSLTLQDSMNVLEKDELNSMCNIINHNAQYLSKTIDDFRNFIKGERVIKTFNLKENIQSFLELMKGAISNNELIVKVNVPDTIYIDGYPNELIQCFINIFNNSKDALKEIECEKIITIDAKLEKDHILIKFTDNAGGIPKDILPRIFEPYYTTKHKSQGTGLGLSMTYNLITNGMNGSIVASNIEHKYRKACNKGAAFFIEIPLKAKE